MTSLTFSELNDKLLEIAFGSGHGHTKILTLHHRTLLNPIYHLPPSITEACFNATQNFKQEIKGEENFLQIAQLLILFSISLNF